MTAISSSASPTGRPALSRPVPSSLGLLMGAEGLAGVLGFLAMVHLARTLGPEGFAPLEFALSVSAWLLVLVRGGIEVLVYREAARRPRLIHALTGHLIGLRLATSAFAYVVILTLLFLTPVPDQWPILPIAGLILWPSALVCDVGPRARALWNLPALAQSAKACAYAVAAWSLVSNAGDLAPAALCLTIGELVAMILLLTAHVREFGWPRPRYRRGLWAVLIHRGIQTTLLRFLRVGLYAADVLVLGWFASDDLGPYAAARRVVFALVSVGLVVPAALGTVLARAWARGEEPARVAYLAARTRILGLALPCSCGLALTSGRVLNTLFGPGFEGGGLLLALLAIRLPWMLLTSLDVSALVACRQERQALGLIGSVAALAALTMPLSAWFGGAVAVGLTLLALEAIGSVGGVWRLRKLGVTDTPSAGLRTPLVGCLVMTPVCLLTQSWPLPLTCGLGALTYLAVWRMQTRPLGFDMEGASE